ncbi:chromatin assembly factor 1 subunit A-A-like [Nasonia vitripennis]|uniref:Uncharacterized protein n=1 Tax=Nasonia vitripennis TaxID=7425 RepID=A0A7M7Q2C2_NASVI|nr:chromatin assembly factor 1 subunit A-A-like [Nasonia vitripennis]
MDDDSQDYRNEDHKNRNREHEDGVEETNKPDRQNNVVDQLKLKLREERRHRLRAIEALSVLREKKEEEKRQKEDEEHKKKAEKAEVAAQEKQKEVRGFPQIMNADSEIPVKKAAVQEAYAQKELSRFYINMMYAAWGRSRLSERCVKKTKKIRT